MKTTMRSRALLFLALLLLAGCAGRGPAPATERGTATPSAAYTAEGKATYYGRRHHGRRTASGETYDQNALTAAHRSLPFGSKVEVTNLRNGRSVVVRINDRGPYGSDSVIIDLSRAAAVQLDMLRAGTVPVRIEGR
jgi:rare lipoprotein A